MLFDARVHEPLLEAAWRPAEVEAAIRAIARDAEDALRDGDWWPIHPLDAEDGDPDVIHGVYLGAAGVVWALDHLTQAGLHEPRHDAARLAEDVLESYLRRPEFGGPLPSILMGEGGIALVAWLLSPAPARADRLAELLIGDPDGDTLAGGELTWAAGPLRKGANLCHGTAGNGFALLKLFTRTEDERWLQGARGFAMHAAAQVAAARREFGRGRYSLWTGDLGTAVYLRQCLAGSSEMPTIDLW